MVTPTPIKKYVLDNGLTVLHQRNPYSRAFSIGAWTRSGARDERPGEEGLCHFLEHMLFKGTRSRSAFDISMEIESIGGSIDAFTTKETMCVYAQVIEDQRSVAFDLIGDMLTSSTFTGENVEVERRVVLEEIGDVMDAPDDVIHELFASAVFPDHPLGRPILGTPDSVGAFERSDLKKYWRRVFRANNLVITVYGNVSERELRKTCLQKFGFPEGVARRNGAAPGREVPARQHVRRKLHQQHICLGTRTFSYHEQRRFALMILTTLLGGGMSSRLFQRIREERGLSYNVYTYADHLCDTGLMATYMAVRPSNAGQAIREVLAEFERVRGGDVKRAELDAVRDQLKGRILLGLETSTAKMMRLARNELSYGRQVSERELIRQLDAVSPDDLLEVADEVLDPARVSLLSLGPSAAGIRIGQ